jgi:hypothetical protein
LPELAAPSDWEVEVPIVFDVPLPPAVWVRATVVDLGPVSCEPVVEEEFLDVEEEAWT